jgi:V-type H+-transporting ATPase subunit a
LKTLADIRYLLTLMGFFALYNGFIYNDFSSIGFNIFGSCYDFNVEIKENISLFNSQKRPGCVYSVGIDPIWSMTENDIVFFNNLKMKLSVFYGIV